MKETRIIIDMQIINGSVNVSVMQWAKRIY